MLGQFKLDQSEHYGMSNMERGLQNALLLIISGPSGCGKTTVCKCLVKELQNVVHSVSVTTRLPRPGEVDSIDYHFVTVEQFKSMQHDLVESVELFGNYYGTVRSIISDYLKNGVDVVCDLNFDGMLNLKKNFSERVVSIFLLPPSDRSLKDRLFNRNTDSADTIRQRMDNAEDEIRNASLYDYSIVNQSLDTTVAEVIRILQDHKSKLSSIRPI